MLILAFSPKCYSCLSTATQCWWFHGCKLLHLVLLNITSGKMKRLSVDTIQHTLNNGLEFNKHSVVSAYTPISILKSLFLKVCHTISYILPHVVVVYSMLYMCIKILTSIKMLITGKCYHTAGHDYLLLSCN